MDGIVGTVIVLVIVAAVVGFAVFSLVKNKLEGRSSCGCSCGSCPMSGSCHEKKDQSDDKQ